MQKLRRIWKVPHFPIWSCKWCRKSKRRGRWYGRFLFRKNIIQFHQWELKLVNFFLDAVVPIIEDQLYFYLLLPTYFTKLCNCNFFSDPTTIPPLASHSYYTGGMHTTNTFQNVLIMKNSTGSHLYSKFRLSLAQSGFRIGYWKKLTYYITSYHYPTFGL